MKLRQIPRPRQPKPANRDTALLQTELDSAMLRLAMTGLEHRRLQRALKWIIGIILVTPLAVLAIVLLFSALFPLILFFLVVIVGVGIGCVRGLRTIQWPNNYVVADRAIASIAQKLHGHETLIIDPQARKRLHLRAGHAPEETVLAILRVLTVVGDTESLDVIHHLAGAAGAPAVRQEAARCADRLRERLEAARRIETLLRPADAIGGAELLRPAGAPGHTPEAQLLRAEEMTE